MSPHINIWTVARPIVEKYIADNIGPRALVRDLANTARVVGRFGPRLPQLAEAALIRQSQPKSEPGGESPSARVLWMVLGGLLVALGVVIGIRL